MSRRSLDSQTPIMAASVPPSKNGSVRLSIISNSPSFSSQNSESGYAEIKQLTKSLSRLENKTLTAQRVTLSEQKSDTMSKLALGAKVERALGRRMTNQDAVYKPKRLSVMSEKPIKVDLIQDLIEEKITYACEGSVPRDWLLGWM